MKRGFTLIETLSVIVIIAVLSSFLMPVLGQSLWAARASADLQKLKQLHVAFTLYRMEHDGDGRYGKASDMGLPDGTEIEEKYIFVAREPELWKSACGLHPHYEKFARKQVQFIYPPCNQWTGCGEYYAKHQDQAMLLIDTNCADPAAQFDSVYYSKKVLGIRLNGQAKAILTTQSPGGVDNWH